MAGGRVELVVVRRETIAGRTAVHCKYCSGMPCVLDLSFWNAARRGPQLALPIFKPKATRSGVETRPCGLAVSWLKLYATCSFLLERKKNTTPGKEVVKKLDAVEKLNRAELHKD